MRVYKFCSYIQKIEESPTVNLMSNVRGRMGSMRLPMSLKGVV